METRAWSSPPKHLTLAPDRIDVWLASLDLPSSKLAELGSCLTKDEHERAARFYFERDRQYFIAGRGRLRWILGQYLDLEPGQLRFQYNPYGKPSLDGGALRFNLSHSGGLALFAVTRDREVGVDVERIRSEVTQAGIARRYFSPREVAALEALPLHLQPQAFFNCWTRKEAYIKARGKGLSIPLEAFDVTLEPGKPARLLSVRNAPTEASRWSLRELDAGPGFAAALAVEGNNWVLRCWLYPV